MTVEADKLKARHRKERNPAERAHLRAELDQIPLSSNELAQVQQREHDRKVNDIKVFREERKQ